MTIFGGALLVVGIVVPLPFVELAPGPTFNVIGDYRGEPVITISGTPTFPTAGNLDMTTVNERGGPRSGINIGRVVVGWADPTIRVLPRSALFPEDTRTDAEVKAENVRAFSDSQADAIAASLSYLDRPFTTLVVVSSVRGGTPADGKLEPGDELLTIDTTTITVVEDVAKAMSSVKPGETVTVRYKREGKEGTTRITTTASPADPNRAFLGITIGETYEAPFAIDFSLDGVGGPSAGMMFSLGIVDKLTPGELNGGKFVAGTGTIAPDGRGRPDRRHRAEARRGPTQRRHAVPRAGRQLRGGARHDHPGRAHGREGDHAGRRGRGRRGVRRGQARDALHLRLRRTTRLGQGGRERVGQAGHEVGADEHLEVVVVAADADRAHAPTVAGDDHGHADVLALGVRRHGGVEGLGVVGQRLLGRRREHQALEDERGARDLVGPHRGGEHVVERPVVDRDLLLDGGHRLGVVGRGAQRLGQRRLERHELGGAGEGEHPGVLVPPLGGHVLLDLAHELDEAQAPLGLGDGLVVDGCRRPRLRERRRRSDRRAGEGRPARGSRRRLCPDGPGGRGSEPQRRVLS